MNVIIQTNERILVAARMVAAMAFAVVSGCTHAAIDQDQSRVAAPPGDGWQMLSAPGGPTASKVDTARAGDDALPASSVQAVPSNSIPTAVASVVLPGAPSSTAGTLTFSVSPQDLNLRNALDRWLQTQGWQLAWTIDDDLPLEFNATFSGDFTSVLTQVMRATNHMRVPTRICRHTNNVIRVIARAANCQE